MKLTLRSEKHSSTLVPVVLVATALLCATSAAAQDSMSWQKYVAGGVSTIHGEASDVVDDGVSFVAGVILRPEGRRLGVSLELGLHDFDIHEAVARSHGARKGAVDIVSLTVGPTWVFDNDSNVGFQFSVGVGIYDVTGELTDPGLYLGPGCDRWFWWCFPGIVPGEVIVDRASTTRFGFNIGLGVAFDVGTRKQIFLEARYHRVETRLTTEFMPLTIGFRF
jgi:opacity protein-like surface antigen